VLLLYRWGATGGRGRRAAFMKRTVTDTVCSGLHSCSAVISSHLQPPTKQQRSYSDGLADAARVAALASELRLSGHPVLEQAWADSSHVSHAVEHPEQYESCVRCRRRLGLWAYVIVGLGLALARWGCVCVVFVVRRQAE
jgi:hypothetical protein